MRKFLLNPAILTCQTYILTDILTSETNFLRSDYFGMNLEFYGQKAKVFLLITLGPHTSEHYYNTEMTEQLNPGKNFKTAAFA